MLAILNSRAGERVFPILIQPEQGESHRRATAVLPHLMREFYEERG